MSADPEKVLTKFEELSFFDNLALYYLCNETPPNVLSLVFLVGDSKIVGSMLGVLDKKRREYIHTLMSKNAEESQKNKDSAMSGLLLIADNLIARNLISKKGQFYFGVQK